MRQQTRFLYLVFSFALGLGTSVLMGCPGGPVDDVRSCAFSNGLPQNDPPLNVERLIFAGANIEVLLYRVNAGQGAGFTTVYEPGGFALDIEGEVTCVGDVADLTYDWSHHNWIEKATAKIGDLTWVLDITFQPEGDPVTTPWVWKHILTAEDSAGAVVEGPFDLALIEGAT